MQFLVLGGLIFAMTSRPDSVSEIHLDGSEFSALEAAQARRDGAPTLASDEATAVRTRLLEDEILYREAIRLGLDKNDNVVRQRLIQKVLFLAEDLGGAARAPTEEDLRRFFDATRSQWVNPAHIRLIHVYASPAHQAQLAALRTETVAADSGATDTPPALGDAFGLPRGVDKTREELANVYGTGFATAVFNLPLGVWSEPIMSKFGWHLVKVLERHDAAPASFEDVRGKLPLLCLAARKQQAVADFLRQAAQRYRISIDGQRVTGLPLSGRVAAASSNEGD